MTLAEKKALITGFLEHCNRYADGKLAEYRRRLDRAGIADSLPLQDKIGHWTAYRSFNAYTIEELAGTELDDWLIDDSG